MEGVAGGGKAQLLPLAWRQEHDFQLDARLHLDCVKASGRVRMRPPPRLGQGVRFRSQVALIGRS